MKRPPVHDRRAAEPSGPPGLASRRAAVDAVVATLARTATLDDALAAQAEADPLARAIAVTSFRRFGTLRDALEARLDKGLPADATLFAILLTGAAQILYLDVPDHAAVDLAVRLASAAGRRTRHLAGLVNAVLRRVARERDAILSGATAMAELPDWLAARWVAAYGRERTEAFARAHALGGALDLTCRSDPAGWAERLDGVLLPTGTVRISDRRAVDALPGYRDGEWWVQDAAAALPARILDARPGERVLDMCAAPGGKTAQLAATGAAVTALDRSAPRLRRVAENLERLRLPATLRCTDALAFAEAPFDAVLLDAPCTATGTIRRRPDVAWTKSEDDVAALVDLQGRLLDRAAALVRPGGRLVYCVCSLEREEGPDGAAAFGRRHPAFSRRPVAAGAFGIGAECLDDAGDLRTAPDLWPDGPRPAPGPRPASGPGSPSGPEAAWRPGLDGFYAALFVRDGG